MIETANPLRVGVMLDSLTVPAWIAHVLRQLAEAPFVELALVVLNAEPRPPAPRFARLRSPRRHHLLFQLYARVDRRVFRRDPDAFAEVAMADELRSVPKREVVPLRPGEDDRQERAVRHQRPPDRPGPRRRQLARPRPGRDLDLGDDPLGQARQ